jgi:hypothetical protein
LLVKVGEIEPTTLQEGTETLLGVISARLSSAAQAPLALAKERTGNSAIELRMVSSMVSFCGHRESFTLAGVPVL